MKRCNICQKRFFFQSSLDSHARYDHPRSRLRPAFVPVKAPVKPSVIIARPALVAEQRHDDDMPVFIPVPDFGSSASSPEPYSGGGGSFAGGGASGSYDPPADFSNVSSGSDSTASSGD